MADINISDAIYGKLFGPEFDTSGVVQRRGRPFVFTSDYMMQQALGGPAQGVVDAIVDQGTVDTPTSVKTAVISMAVNPNSIKWSQAKRITRKDTIQGATFFHFSDRNGQNNDILTLDFSGQTGSIWGRDPANKQKLVIWHMLYRMSREPMHYSVVNDAGVTTRYANKQYIYYQTTLFPTQIQFTGFFSRVLEFEETADDPFNRRYTMGFTVTGVNPPLDDIVSTLL